MEKILGLDLGTNSIGWAIRDITEKENQIIDKGVLTFEKGVGEGKSGEFPLVQIRTESRRKRRNYQAEKYRKWALLQTLIDNNMCPLSIHELDEWRKYTKNTGRKYPQSSRFIEWLRFDFDGDGKPDFENFGFSKYENHYLFRMLIISDEEQNKKIFKDNPHIIGRVLYHLVQRRGFRGRDDEEAKTIMQGSKENGTIGADKIVPFIGKYRTLGAALYHLHKEKNERIRKRYNLRTDYEQELKEICRIQQVDNALYKKFWKAIIWQRPLRSQKGLVGICTFENNKSRCPISHPLYEEYRTWVFINNLKIELPAGIDRASFLKEKIYPLFYKKDRDFKLGSIMKELKKVGGGIKSKFNYADIDEGKKRAEEKKNNDTKVISCTLLNNLKDLLGDDWKDKFGWKEALQNQSKNCPYSFEDIWHVLFSFDSREKLDGFAKGKLGLKDDSAEKFSKIKLQQGYATLSLAAIKKILPYLQQGFIYSHAIYLANLHKIFGKKQITFEEAAGFSTVLKDIFAKDKNDKLLAAAINSLISDQINSNSRFGMDINYQLDEDDRNDIYIKLKTIFGDKTWEGEKSGDERNDDINFVTRKYLEFLRRPVYFTKENLFIKPERLHDKIFNHIRNTYDVPEENKRHLWHPSEQEIYLPAKEKRGILQLGDPQPITRGFKNPMALKTLHKLKKLLNHLLQTGKIEDDTRIVIEIARELNDTNKRKAIEKWQRDREKENDEFRKRILEISEDEKINLDINKKDTIDKYRLWIEQNRMCLYTGSMINCSDLFNGAKYDFEHTIPASISFDNELKNLTIADGVYNKQIKGNKFPTQLPNYNQDITIDGKEYTAIKPRIEFIEDKVTSLEALVDEWVNKRKFASTKKIKDACIQRIHVLRFELAYWRKKLETFTLTEYKAGWRNSQLRDTQTVTKYALPYLKTIFHKVEVQKGAVTAAFREIYRIQRRTEKKDRSKHSHHAIDAAILTLIPPAAIRDKILLRYNELKDENQNATYHEPVRQWDNFKPYYILAIENDTLINFQVQQRTLTPTYKTVRKRGKKQFVKEKMVDGKWQYRLNKTGAKIPLISKGDTIRGQLHEESFMTLIKQPEYELTGNKFIPKTDGKGNFIFHEKNGEPELFVVKKINLSELDSIEKLKKIIDPNLRIFLTNTISERISSGKSFQQAIAEPIWAFNRIKDRNGNSISPLRHIRCRVAKAAGFLSKEKTLDIRKNDFVSKFAHKREVLAGNDEMVLCLYYEKEEAKGFRLVSRFELAILKVKKLTDLFYQRDYNKFLKGSKKIELPLNYIIQAGCRILLLDEKASTVNELKQLTNSELLNRLFLVNNFNTPAVNTIYIYLINHIEARSKEVLQKEEEKNVDMTKFQPKLALTADKFKCLIEGRDFSLDLDGTIRWIG